MIHLWRDHDIRVSRAKNGRSFHQSARNLLVSFVVKKGFFHQLHEEPVACCPRVQHCDKVASLF